MVVQAIIEMLALHKLIDIGLDEDLAECVREELDVSCRGLSRQEHDWINQLSARLNAARDVETAAMTDRIEELDRAMHWVNECLSKSKPTEEPLIP